MGGCHHDLHDVITSITLIWATEGLAGRDRETEKGRGGEDLRDLPAEDHLKSNPTESKYGVVRIAEDVGDTA